MAQLIVVSSERAQNWAFAFGICLADEMEEFHWHLRWRWLMQRKKEKASKISLHKILP